MKLSDFIPGHKHGECEVIVKGPDQIAWYGDQQQLALVYQPPDQIPWTTTGVWFPAHVVLVVREVTI